MHLCACGSVIPSQTSTVTYKGRPPENVGRVGQVHVLQPLQHLLLLSVKQVHLRKAMGPGGREKYVHVCALVCVCVCAWRVCVNM